MNRRPRERGAALILLIGITATLAILAAMLVSMLANQEHATAQERTRKTTQQYADGALDTAVTYAKAKRISTTSASWLTTQELLDAFAAGFPGGVLPDGMTVAFSVYDNGGTGAAYDANGDGMMWVEVVLTYKGKTSRSRRPHPPEGSVGDQRPPQGRGVQRHRRQARRHERHIRRRG